MKWLALWLILGGVPADSHVAKFELPRVVSATSKSTTQQKELCAEERTITVIRDDFRSSMRAEAKANRGTPTHRMAIGDLIRLHREMVRHRSFEQGFALKQSRALLQSRLVRIERAIRDQHNCPRKPVARHDKRHHQNQPVHVAAQAPLAQFPFNAGGANRQGAPGGGVNNANGELPDIGPELADLIQRVVDPKFWDVNGGPGSIVYFQPLRALVVTATAEVHANLAGAMGQMRAVR